jgi:hypothetical protein
MRCLVVMDPVTRQGARIRSTWIELKLSTSAVFQRRGPCFSAVLAPDRCFDPVVPLVPDEVVDLLAGGEAGMRAFLCSRTRRARFDVTPTQIVRRRPEAMM